MLIRYALLPYLLVVALSLALPGGRALADDWPQLQLPEAGINPRTLAVIANRQDPLSLAIADYYLKARNIPADNLVLVSFAPGQANMHPGEFAVLRRQIEAATPAAVQAYATTWTQPYRVGCMSFTSALSFGYDRSYCAEGCRSTYPSRYAGSATRRPYSELDLRPAMALAATSLDHARALIDRGVASDGSWPRASAYLLETSDPHRSVRKLRLDEARRRFNGQVAVYTLRQQAITGRDAVMFYFTGLPQVPDIASNHYLPGAMADHLTSYGGQLIGSSQMSALRWLEAGATGSYGTVVEPCAFPAKFPDPVAAMAHYLAGESLIEAYWKSVRQPGQGIFIGEPLASPYRAYHWRRQGRDLVLSSPLLKPGEGWSLQAAAGREGPWQAVATTPGEASELRVPPPHFRYYRLRRDAPPASG
ncbi:MAG: TIGR03790 family protein [Spongiibacteraceae bacterium]|nr:TIGR03790 family protein [Spongiibacteraceae bacterium]